MYAVVSRAWLLPTWQNSWKKKVVLSPGSRQYGSFHHRGNVAENGGGLRGLKYGVTKDYVMGLNFFDAR